MNGVIPMEILNYEFSSKIMKPPCALHHRSRDEHRQASNQHSRWSCSVAHYSSTLLSSQHSGWPPTWSCVIKTVWLIEINKPLSSFKPITPGEGGVWPESPSASGIFRAPELRYQGGSGQTPPGTYNTWKSPGLIGLKKSNVYPHQSRITLNTLLWDTL